MRWKCVLVAAAAMECVCAQTWEIAPESGYLRLSKKPIGSLNSTAKDDDTKLRQREPAYGVRATYNTDGYYGLEAGYLRSRAGLTTTITSSSSSSSSTSGSTSVVESGKVIINQVFLNGLCYFMPKAGRFRPYVTAGLQLQFWTDPGLADWTAGSSKNIGFNYGGGLKVRLFKPVLFRLDVRDIFAGAPYSLKYADDPNVTTFRSPGLYRMLEATVGIAMAF